MCVCVRARVRVRVRVRSVHLGGKQYSLPPDPAEHKHTLQSWHLDNGLALLGDRSLFRSLLCSFSSKISFLVEVWGSQARHTGSPLAGKTGGRYYESRKNLHHGELAIWADFLLAGSWCFSHASLQGRCPFVTEPPVRTGESARQKRASRPKLFIEPPLTSDHIALEFMSFHGSPDSGPIPLRSCWYVQGNHQKPGFLRWCRISECLLKHHPTKRELI